jgi:hypothetical protein
VTVTLESEEDLKATVDFQGGMCVHNKMEIKRRPVRAEERNVLGEKLQTQLPRSMYLQKIGPLKEDVLASGCRDEAPTPNVLKNISLRLC